MIQLSSRTAGTCSQRNDAVSAPISGTSGWFVCAAIYVVGDRAAAGPLTFTDFHAIRGAPQAQSMWFEWVAGHGLKSSALALYTSRVLTRF